MFIPIEQTAWPAAGEVRELRFSLNAPVLLGPGEAPQPTRAALGWLPAGSSSVVRLWLRADGAPHAVRGFDLPDQPLGPAARAEALECAERFLGGLGFLFSTEPACAGERPCASQARAVPQTSRTSDPDPAPELGPVVRADVRLTKFRRRGPRAEAADGALSPSEGIEL